LLANASAAWIAALIFGIAGLAAAADNAEPVSVAIDDNLQSALACPGDWQPSCSATHLGNDADDTVGQGVFSVPAGIYEYKLALNSWYENYGRGSENQEPGNRGDAVLISNGANDGNPYFYFLPPLVHKPTTIGVFDADLEPTVEICQLDGSVCLDPPLVTYTMDTGSGANRIRVHLQPEHYIADWFEGDFNRDESAFYRIRVFVEAQELGFVDVDIISSRSEDTPPEFVPILIDQTVPIKFRIEVGALADCGNGVIDPGETCDGDCPESCDDGDPCTLDELNGSAEECTAYCSYQPLSQCSDDGGCCPAGCSLADDNDCPDICGDGYCSASEDYQTCPEDCLCVPDCEGRECGDDGCGGTCLPGCAEDEVCTPEGFCEVDCDRDDDGYDGEQCGGPDCDDGNELIHPDAEEVCNEVDDDCDGIVDIPIGPLHEPLRVTNDPGSSTLARLVWTGAEYGVAWEDDRDGDPAIYLARISEDAELLDEIRMTDGYSKWPQLVWTGTDYGLAWTDSRTGWFDIFFALVSASGEKIGDDVRVTTYPSVSYLSSLVGNGPGFGVAWHDYRLGGYLEIFFAILDETGTKITDDILVTADDNHSSIGPKLAWTGDEYGIAWTDQADLTNEIYFGRISDVGEVQEGQVRVSELGSTSSGPSLVWTGSEYAMCWLDSRHGETEIYFARVSESGELLGDEVRVTDTDANSTSPSLIWNGAEFGVAWVEGSSGSTEVYFVRLASDGTVLGDMVRVSSSEGAAQLPSLVYNGENYALSWQDTGDGNYEIYFVTVGGCF